MKRLHGLGFYEGFYGQTFDKPEAFEQTTFEVAGERLYECKSVRGAGWRARAQKRSGWRLLDADLRFQTL